MRFTSFALALPALLATASADCSRADARPDDGDVAVYTENNCSQNYHNIGAMYSCQNWPDYWICSAITRPGVVCALYSVDGCEEKNMLYTVDETGFRTMCPGILRKKLQSVRCWNKA